jgi:peptidyl-prolyl cis-trans isomerase D
MDIFDILRADRADEQAKAEAERLVQDAQQGKALATLAEGSDELKLEIPGWVKRDTKGLNAALRQRAFTLAHPQDDQPVYDVVSLGKGDYAVLAVKGLREGDSAKLKEEERTRLQKQLLSGRGQAEFDALLKGFRERSEVKIFEQNL